MPRKARKRTYGTGSVTRAKGRSKWTVRWRENGQRMHKTYDTEAQAKDGLSQILSNLREGRAGVEQKSTETLNDYAKIWFEHRKATIRSIYDDRNRWKNHCQDTIGKLTPNEVTVSTLKSLFRDLLKEKKLEKSTIRLVSCLISSMYQDLVEEGKAKFNPARLLSKKTRAQFLTPKKNPKDVPFVQTTEDVGRIYRALSAIERNYGVAYAIGAMAGLRTSEVQALPWSSIDFVTNRIVVRVQRERRPNKDQPSDGTTCPKDNDPRSIPIFDSLLPILEEQYVLTGGRGTVVKFPKPPVRKNRTGKFIRAEHMASNLKKVLKQLGLPKMTWYQATRHTFASQWVSNGGSLEKLREFMGHSTVLTTERYAHLSPEFFTDKDRSRVKVDFKAPEVPVQKPSEKSPKPDQPLQ